MRGNAPGTRNGGKEPGIMADKVWRLSAGTMIAAISLLAGIPAGAADTALNDCDRLVKVPGDYGHPSDAHIPITSMTTPEAAAACRKAIEAAPDTPRYELQLAFVLLYPTSLYFPNRTAPPAEGWTYLDKAAAEKYPGALFFKAHIVESGRFPELKTVETALPVALALYEESAELGNPAAMVRLAREYSVAGGGKLRRGKTGSVESDMDTAMAWALKAIEAGHPRGEVIYANLVLTGGPVRDEDRADAIARLERRMGEGDCDAYWALGSYKFNKGEQTSLGGPVAANPDAVRLLRTAAEGGHYAAQRMMAGFYGPDGVFEADPVESRIWMEKAKAAQVSGSATGKDCGWK